MSRNFTNGSLVLLVWPLTGGTEIVANFQYYSDAKDFAEAQAKKINPTSNVFYIAVCDYENEAKAYFKSVEVQP
jgi:hypothetical protein